MTIKLNVKTDYGNLKSLVIGLPDNFHQSGEVELVNEKQKKYYTDEKPTPETLTPEFKQFEKTLEESWVTIYQQKPVPGIPDQLTPRDIGFVIGNTFIVAGMAKESRKQEYKGIEDLFKDFEGELLSTPKGISLEGGDVIVDDPYIFVGMSSRSTMQGVEFLKKNFKGWYVVPVYLKALSEGEDVLHLDCTFMPTAEEEALIYKPGFKEIPKEISKKYGSGYIEVTQQEQSVLATNVLQLGQKKIISRDIANSLNEKLKSLGYVVIPLKFNEAPKTGGSFHCCSLPLYRI